jgi:hypothetical protein
MLIVKSNLIMFKEIHSYDLIKLNQNRSLIMIVKVV